MPIINYGQFLVFSFLLFSVVYAVEHYFLIIPKYAVSVPAVLVFILLLAEAARVNIRRLAWSARWLGIYLPFFILVFGILAGVYRFSETYPVYFIGDCYVIGQFILLGLIFALKGIDRYADKIFWGFFTATIVTSFSASYFSYTKFYAAVDRFIPFDILFVITSAWFAFYRNKLLGLLVLGVLLVMAAMSGMRLGFFLMVMMPLFIMTVARRKIFAVNRVSLAAFIMVILAVIFAVFNAEKLSSLSTIDRFIGTFEGSEHQMVSVNSRYGEASTAIMEQLNGPPFFVIFGNGHGALYKEVVSWDLEVNLTPKGTHNIHVSPALFFFRYGVPGIAWYVLLILYAAKRTVRMLFLSQAGPVNDCAAINALYLFAMLMSSILGQNNFIYMNIPVAFFLNAVYERLAQGQYAGNA
ncbi:MAG: hypothetical protein HZB83_00045 [Deltaproteobacteria bacterium]|nr:hypothetical protein [Deltaproteobacteria bacterium]